MRCRIVSGSDLWLALLLAVVGSGLIWQQQKMDAAAVATLVGALFGGAALLLGNWINRRSERRRATEDLMLRRTQLKTLIAAEMVNVAAGLIDAKSLVDAALTTLNAGGHVPDQTNLSSYLPRPMPFSDSLGAELLTLESPATDALATLRSNLAITRMTMESISLGRERFGLLTIIALANGLGHDMAVLADAFEHIAPTRQLAFLGQQAELATAILRRMSTGTLPGAAA